MELTSTVHYNKIPGCVYCQPEVGTIGMTEKQVKEKGYDYTVGKFPFKAAGKAVAVGDTEGFVKIISDKKTWRNTWLTYYWTRRNRAYRRAWTCGLT